MDIRLKTPYLTPMQNTQNSIMAVQLYLRDLRLTATEREQVSGLVGNIGASIERDLQETRKVDAAKQTPKVLPRTRNGDPDKDIASGDEDRAFAEVERR